MKNRTEWLFYITVGVGMALATSAFTMVASLFTVAAMPWILLGIVFASVFSVVIALSIGEMASMFPSAPGVRTYLKVAFGDTPSLILVYLYMTFVVLVAGLESFVFSQVVIAVFPQAVPVLTVLVLLGVVVVVNLLGIEAPRSMQIMTTILSVLLIFVSGISALVFRKIDMTEMFKSDISWQQLSILPAIIGMSVFLYTGFEWVTPLGLRPKAYERKIPFSMPIAILVLCLVYILFVVGASSQIPVQDIKEAVTPQINYFTTLYGKSGPYLALALSITAIFSTFNAGIMGGSKLLFILAREGHLPRWCGAVSSRTEAPVGAIGLLGGLATLSALTVLTFRLEIIAALVSAAIMCCIYSAFMLATIRLRRIKPSNRRPFKTPIPYAVQLGLALVLILIGIQTLFSQPELRLQTGICAVLCVMLASVLTVCSRAHAKQESNRLSQTN